LEYLYNYKSLSKCSAVGLRVDTKFINYKEEGYRYYYLFIIIIFVSSVGVPEGRLKIMNS